MGWIGIEERERSGPRHGQCCPSRSRSVPPWNILSNVHQNQVTIGFTLTADSPGPFHSGTRGVGTLAVDKWYLVPFRADRSMFPTIVRLVRLVDEDTGTVEVRSKPLVTERNRATDGSSMERNLTVPFSERSLP